MRRQRCHEGGHQRNVHHRDLIHDQQVGRERISLAAFEPAITRIGFEQKVDGLGRQAGAFGQRILRMELIKVALPTPSLPVTTNNLLVSARATAAR
jgi:hypothetical protein